MTLYKVTTTLSTSAIAEHATTIVKYRPQMWSEAPDWLAEKGYHLLVFANLEAACACFPLGLSSRLLCVWEVECEEQVALPPIARQHRTLHAGT